MVNVIRRDFIWYGFLAISSLLGWGLYLTAVVFIVFIERKWYYVGTSTQYVCQMKIHSQQLYSQRDHIFGNTFSYCYVKNSLEVFYFRYIIIKCERKDCNKKNVSIAMRIAEIRNPIVVSI